MGLCIGEAGKYSREKDLGKAWLKMIEDFVKFSAERNFEIIELASSSLISGDLLLEISKKIKEKISQFREATYHLPLGEINISALHSGIRKEAISETKKHVNLCQKIGIKRAIMHPGSFSAMPDIYSILRERTMKIATESIFKIFDYCKERNIELSIENLPRTEPLFQKPEEFEPFIKRGMGMVLDTVHAFESNVNPFDFIMKFGDKITEVHLTDGVYQDPITHYPIGLGEVDCLAVLRELQKRNWQGLITIEVNSKGDLIKSQEYLREKGYL